MHDNTAPHADRFIPFKQEGWGIALLVVLLAVATAGWAGYVHKTTYKHPTDVHFRSAGSSSPAAAH